MSEALQNEGGSTEKAALTGEVIYESVHRTVNKKLMKKIIHQALDRRMSEVPDEAVWASYLVIFSPGQDYEEVRCQIDVETDGKRAGFAIGYGQKPEHAFHDALERLQWYEKNNPIRMIV